ncbi:type 1 glutamine amidotransferase [Rhodovarius crocodyli]|uniref:Type 1 glutamine amidotransferase n=1 Tax=Rhodovarius crocodyli TaxID=1979269 RepID=A0A437MCZ5_9PROT|nr:type 1 glutamine amidotransferase [Rhodovarius crocodyli]RVT95516.1 type 1 glutamine amidotransferase [Rhodovarius crocodyli]
MSLGILQCGAPPDYLAWAYGSYGEMSRELLAQPATIFDVTKGELPESPTAFSAYLVTGSPAGVYDDLPWIPPLMDFLRAARGRAKLVGICFGHQAIATAFGGEVVKSPKGWGLGLQRYRVTGQADWMEAPVAEVAAPAFHQDQVVRPPADARVMIESDFTPYAGLDYGDAISVQFHPEFRQDFCKVLVEGLRARWPDHADAALASYSQPDDCARVGGWIRNFLSRT